MLVFFVIVLFWAAPVQAQIKIDGLFFDWPAKAHLDVSPRTIEKIFADGDDTDPVRGSTDPNYFVDMDIDDIYAMDDADYVYIRIKMNSSANVNNIATDTSYHGGGAIAVYISVDPGPLDTTGLTWGWWGSGYDFFVQAYPPDTAMSNHTIYPQALWEHKQAGNGWDFTNYDTTRGVQIAWNPSANDVEMAIPKAMLFHPHFLPGLARPDSIAIMVYAGENDSPWRADYASEAGVKGYMVQMKPAGKIAVDGLMFDWQSSMQMDVAPQTEEATFANGDDTDPARGSADPSYFADMDIEDVFATDDDDFLYVRIKMNSVANVLNIATDTSYHGGGAIAAYISVDPGPADTSGLTWGWWGSGYDFFVQAYPADSAFQATTAYQQTVWEHTQAGTGWDFVVASIYRGSWVSWNASNNDVEIAVPKAILLNPQYLPSFRTPDSVAVMIYAGENNSPWRADYASNPGIKGYMVPLKKVTGVASDPRAVPAAFELLQNYPNPFNPATTIKYALASGGMVSLKVYNLLGQEVATLVHQVQPAGVYAVRFNANALPSGMYLYRLQSDRFSESHKMLLLK
jgi:hypothetical protein